MVDEGRARIAEAISGRAGKLWNERMTNWLGVA